MAPESLADAIGAPYRIHSLKSRQFGWRRFRRRLQFEGRFLTPSTALVEVEDGRRFKLLSTSHNNRHWINHHLYNYEAASRLDFVPRLIWHDDQHILVEFIEGKTPAIEDDSFAVALGTPFGEGSSSRCRGAPGGSGFTECRDRSWDDR